MKKNIYILSGLGADERVFHKMDFSDFNFTHIKWIKPEKGETIDTYAKRLSIQITDANPILIGLSFGGLMAIELSKIIETEKVILLASCKVSKELPFYFRFSGKLGLHRSMPANTNQLNNAGFILNWFFGAGSNTDKLLLKTIIAETDPDFFVWAVDKVVTWKNTAQLKNIFQIHGTADRIFPCRFVQPDIKIKGAGHFLTLTHATQISQMIREICS